MLIQKTKNKSEKQNQIPHLYNQAQIVTYQYYLPIDSISTLWLSFDEFFLQWNLRMVLSPITIHCIYWRMNICWGKKNTTYVNTSRCMIWGHTLHHMKIRVRQQKDTTYRLKLIIPTIVHQYHHSILYPIHLLYSYYSYWWTHIAYLFCRHMWHCIYGLKLSIMAKQTTWHERNCLSSAEPNISK